MNLCLVIQAFPPQQRDDSSQIHSREKMTFYFRREELRIFSKKCRYTFVLGKYRLEVDTKDFVNYHNIQHSLEHSKFYKLLLKFELRKSLFSTVNLCLVIQAFLPQQRDDSSQIHSREKMTFYFRREEFGIVSKQCRYTFVLGKYRLEVDVKDFVNYHNVSRSLQQSRFDERLL